MLLNNFASDLRRLSNIPLHPSLISILTSSNASEGAITLLTGLTSIADFLEESSQDAKVNENSDSNSKSAVPFDGSNAQQM